MSRLGGNAAVATPAVPPIRWSLCTVHTLRTRVLTPLVDVPVLSCGGGMSGGAAAWCSCGMHAQVDAIKSELREVAAERGRELDLTTRCATIARQTTTTRLHVCETERARARSPCRFCLPSFHLPSFCLPCLFPLSLLHARTHAGTRTRRDTSR